MYGYDRNPKTPPGLKGSNGIGITGCDSSRAAIIQLLNVANKLREKWVTRP